LQEVLSVSGGKSKPRETVENLVGEYLDADPFPSRRKPGPVRCLVCGRQFQSTDVRSNRICERNACQRVLGEGGRTYRVRS